MSSETGRDLQLNVTLIRIPHRRRLFCSVGSTCLVNVVVEWHKPHTCLNQVINLVFPLVKVKFCETCAEESRRELKFIVTDTTWAKYECRINYTRSHHELHVNFVHGQELNICLT